MTSKLKKSLLLTPLLLLLTGAAYAAFSMTFLASNANKVTAASANLKVTSGVVNADKVLPGASASPIPIVIENTGSLPGDVTLNVTSASGSLCTELAIAITGDATANFDPIANGSVVLGNLAPGATMNLSQVVSRKATGTQLGSTCQWNETVTFSGS